jgi:hypothetical protein
MFFELTNCTLDHQEDGVEELGSFCMVVEVGGSPTTRDGTSKVALEPPPDPFPLYNHLYLI